MNRTFANLVCAFLLIIILAPAVSSQGFNPFNERDDTYRLLGLKRARQAFEAAKADLERNQQLFDNNLITRLEFDRIVNQYTDAEVNYQQSLLAILFEEQYITVSEAVKYQSDDGRKHVRLTLANTSGGSAEFQKLVNVDDELFRALQPDVINNVYVSLLNDGNAIISLPYEAKIDKMRYGQPVELDFQLLQDVDAVTVIIIYGNGSSRSMKILLQKDSSVNRVLVQSEQFSQEVELGSKASFDLTLELFSGVSNTFALEVVNLPEQIGRYFKAPTGSVRLSQVKFAESAKTKKASLEIQLPDRPGPGVLIDTPIPFYVLVLPREKARTIDDLHSRQWSAEELDSLEIGFVRLELLPRGKGELLARLQQLYHAISKDETAALTIDLLNEGSNRIDNIEIKLDLPLGWTKTVDPPVIPPIDIGRETSVQLTFAPPEDVSPGKYEIRIRTSGMSNGQPISAENKNVTMEVLGETNVVGTVLIVGLLICLVGGIVVYGTRLSKR